MPVPQLETEQFSVEDFNEDLTDKEKDFYLTRLVQFVKAQQRDIETLKEYIDANIP